MKYKAKVLISSKNRHLPIAVGYRPHLAKKNSDNLLGVEFIALSGNDMDEYVDCIIQTAYSAVGYSDLVDGQKYDVREGRSIVGEIILLELIQK
ncbi:MAG: hypothetical protein WCD89_04410 [Anaerocolumna sp.]